LCWKGAFVLFSRGCLQQKKAISSHCERPLLFRHTCNKTLVYTTEILLTAVGLRLLTAAPRVTFLVAQESSHKNSSVTKTLREIMTSLTSCGTLSIEYKVTVTISACSFHYSASSGTNNYISLLYGTVRHILTCCNNQILNCTRSVL